MNRIGQLGKPLGNKLVYGFGAGLPRFSNQLRQRNAERLGEVDGDVQRNCGLLVEHLAHCPVCDVALLGESMAGNVLCFL